MNKRFWGWLTSVPSLVSDSEVTNEEQLLLKNKVNSVQGKVFVNNVKTGETTIAYQKRITYPYGSWYTRVAKNSEVEARVGLAIKKWWVKPNAEIKIREYGADKSILDTVYYIEFPEGIPKYKGPVGYQGGPFLGGLNQEQYFIPNSKSFGKVIKSYPVK